MSEREREVLVRYRAAFRAANPGKEPPGIVQWSPGWYKVDGRGAMRRLKQFEEWSERLERRAAKFSPETNEA